MFWKAIQLYHNPCLNHRQFIKSSNWDGGLLQVFQDYLPRIKYILLINRAQFSKNFYVISKIIEVEYMIQMVEGALFSLSFEKKICL